jgi:hypothetical protein
MERFNWRSAEPRAREGDLRARFREARIDDGVHALWRTLLDQLDRPDADLFEVEDQFFLEADAISANSRPVSNCVFISHQRADAHLGERVACLADYRDVDYWLDIHDPTLVRLGATPLSPLVRSLLIAAIVEIALLSSTHIIALHTQNSLASRWVPYELARAKARKFKSKNAAGWFQPQRPPPSLGYPSLHGDYVQLVEMTFDEAGVFQWLPGNKTVAPTDPCNGTTALK